MTLRTLLLLSVALLPACSPDAVAPVEDAPIDDIRAIHIAVAGVPVASPIRAGALGIIAFDLVIEGRDGTLRSSGDARVAWGSTHPSVIDEIFREGTDAYFVRQQNGGARIIAELGSFRDTVSVEIQQVAANVRIETDTLVTFTPGARDITGLPTAYHTMRFAAQRVDSNAFAVASKARINYDARDDAPFDLFPGANGDTLSIAGTTVGAGTVVVRFAGWTDTLPVQVADAYRVLRLTEAPGGAARPLPATLTIPRGTAIIFRNETSYNVTLGDRYAGPLAWTTGLIRAGGVEAQRFDAPGTFQVYWFGMPSLIIVTP